MRAGLCLQRTDRTEQRKVQDASELEEVWNGQVRAGGPRQRRGKGCGKSHEKMTTQVIQHHCHNNSDDKNHDVMKLYIYI